MVRISDARMSGTAYGTIVLHVTPDAASGGPIGLVRNGDRIRLSVARRTLELLVEEAELKRRKNRTPPPSVQRSGVTRVCTTSKFSRPTKAATSASCGRLTRRERVLRLAPWRLGAKDCGRAREIDA